MVAEAIERQIVDLGWPVGRLIGSEAELMRRHRVSRATLREAIRQIEQHGAATMRPGVGGGLVVNQLPRGSVVAAIATYLELVGATLPEALEASMIVEVSAVALAAERISEVDIVRLRALSARLAGTPDVNPPEPWGTLRAIIAEATANPAYPMFIEVGSALHPCAERAEPSKWGPRLIEAERRLVEAIVAGDTARAQQAASDRLAPDRELVKHYFDRFGEGAGRHHAPLGPRAAKTPDSAPGVSRKLSQQVARAIRDDIATQGWPVGMRIGSESDLLARYGVSRAVFREAVRTLERHALVNMQRGSNGGLLSGAPDPAYTVRQAEFYLRSMALNWSSLMEIRRVVDTAAAELAAERATDAGLRDLQEAFAREQAGDMSEFVRTSVAVRDLIGELSQNRVLSLFMRVLGAVTVRPESRGLRPPARTAILESHGRLVRAIVSRDGGMARRRMDQHVRLVEASITAWIIATQGGDPPPRAVRPDPPLQGA